MDGATPAPNFDRLFGGLPPERVAALRHAYELVRAAVPAGYAECVHGNMLAWVIPLARYPRTYNGQPLCLAALAAQKNYNALYLMSLYMSEERLGRFRQAYAAAGLKLDMGKSCVRFRSAADLCDGAITEAIAPVSVEAYLEAYERVKPPKR